MALAVFTLLGLHLALAVASLARENPTVDEVVHLPAGVTYWEKGTFKLYHHNPPLVKMVAALPVIASGAVTAPLYQTSSWTGTLPDQATFAHLFAAYNSQDYFELFTRARLLMPLFSVLGGLVVFAWSSRLYGAAGGLLSLTLWCFCPNVLAHGRLITTDMGATALGVGATYLFWRYLHEPTWRRAAWAGVALGVAQLAKFSLLLLYGLWPLFWMAHELLPPHRPDLGRRLLRGAGQGIAIIALSMLTIDIGYGFEGVGLPLGRFEFASRTLTRPLRPGEGSRPRSPNPLLDVSWQHRVNRFRGTVLERLPTPLPKHYLLGFDEQKIEADGVPMIWLDPSYPNPNEVTGYPVYLDGELRRHGWWYYYLLTLVYKIPEGTWTLVLLSIAVLFVSPRARAPWADEFAVWAVPITVLGAMSFLTDINLGLRYVLPIFPYVFIATGRLAPWITGLAGAGRRMALAMVGGSLLLTVGATLSIHPHYLAYFNWASGGPARGSEHLIDSNLDWGQDLIGLRDWLRRHPQEGPVGLAYFGQINPNLFALRGDGFAWFLPPLRPGRFEPMPGTRAPLEGPAPRVTPGLYAISATLLRGLPWRLYDPSPRAWFQAWRTHEDALGYFRELTPFDHIGYSIFLYRVSPADAQRISQRLAEEAARRGSGKALRSARSGPPRTAGSTDRGPAIAGRLLRSQSGPTFLLASDLPRLYNQDPGTGGAQGHGRPPGDSPRPAGPDST